MLKILLNIKKFIEVFSTILEALMTLIKILESRNLVANNSKTVEEFYSSEEVKAIIKAKEAIEKAKLLLNIKDEPKS